jgi:hypothetical protein
VASELTAPEPRFGPQTVAAARAQVANPADRGVRTLKIWLDDFGGTVPKIPRHVVRALVQAERLDITTFAHVYFRHDAADLISAGIDVLPTRSATCPSIQRSRELFARAGRPWCRRWSARRQTSRSHRPTTPICAVR